mmetsp:Transcript_151/g.205  ORF Transcript_151/g.205 Transcript_151/m.205 type:complete len:121 (-) Transcript_151:146-508(-)
MPESGSLQSKSHSMDKGEWVSTGLGRLVNYGDSDSEHEEIEVILVDKDGDKYKRRKAKEKKKRSVVFLTASLAFKELRAEGKSIDESAMEALKEVSPADRQKVPPITNTLKEQGGVFWMA